MKPLRQWKYRQLLLIPVIVGFLVAAFACELWHLVCDHEFPDY